MVNWFAPGGEAVVACSVMVWLEPSGSVRLNAIDIAGIRIGAEIDRDRRRRRRDGPVTVAPVKLEFTLASWKPNGELARPRLIDTVDAPAAAGMTSRPSAVGALVGLQAFARSPG